MSEEQPAELLPILVAHMADDDARDFLEGVALVGAVAHLMLEAPPMDRSMHALEICTPSGEPLVVFAEPIGPPTVAGYPLRLSLSAPASASGRQASSAPPADLSPRRKTIHTLTERHTSDLVSEPGARVQTRPEHMIGRELSGGKLIIETSVGKGGAGTVYRARHRDLGLAVAVKVMHESFQRDVEYCRKFHAEALAASRLDHAHLTRVLDYGQEPDGLLYLAMEFLDGRSLRDVLRAEKRLDLTRALRLMIQVTTGLTHAHAREVFHRDIKPENLVLVRGLDDDGHEAEIVKVCDFGIAQVSTEAQSTFAGTPEYMAPEQFRGEELDAGVDVYACGVVLYELVTGQLPIHGANLNELRARAQLAIPQAPSARVPNLDPRADGVILRALAKDRNARYATIRDFRSALRALLQPGTPAVDLEPSSPGLKSPSLPPGVSGPEWLERTNSRLNPDGSPPSQDFSRALAPLLRQLAETRELAAFARLVPQLEAWLHSSAEQGDATAVWRIRSTLASIAGEPTQAHGARGPIAEQLLRVCSDPKFLAPLAERALAGASSDADLVVVHAGAGGAYALYSARLKTPEPDARARFVALLSQIGLAAAPMMRAGLERLEPRLELPGGAALAEDILQALPRVPDDAAGETVARYARSRQPGAAYLATAILPFIWGQRARPLLVALTGHRDEHVSTAAIAGLRELAAIDEDVVRKLAPIIAGKLNGPLAPRVAAAEALAFATLEGGDSARKLLTMALSMPDPGAVAPALVLALARSMVAVRGDIKVLAELVRRSSGPLRTELETVFRQAAPRTGP